MIVHFEPASEELARYASWLRERLLAIEVAATKEPLVRNIIVIDDVFAGERRRFLPDWMLQWGPEAPVDRIRSPDIGEIEVSLATGRGGNHNDCAFLIAKGDGEFLDATSEVRDISQIGGIAERYLGRSPAELAR